MNPLLSNLTLLWSVIGTFYVLGFLMFMTMSYEAVEPRSFGQHLTIFFMSIFWPFFMTLACVWQVTTLFLGWLSR